MALDSRIIIPERLETDELRREILAVCYRKAALSPDKSTQVGAVIVNHRNLIEFNTLSFNGFVWGWEPSETDYERPRKYLVTEHSERRAIYKAATVGIALYGCILYSTWAACVDCARGIVESGIEKLVRHYPPLDDATERWLESVSLGDEIMKSGGVEIIDVIGPIPDAPPIMRNGEIYDPA